MKKTWVICKDCKKRISFKKDKYVLIGTYDCEKVKEEGFYHFDCFVKWFNEKVNAKAKNSIKTMQDQAKSLFTQLQSSGFLNNIVGIDKLQSFLNTDLKDMPNLEKMFKKTKTNNDKPKQKTKTKKRS